MKLVILADLREVNDQHAREEISYSRAAEILNEKANKKASEHLQSRVEQMIEHLMDSTNIEVYKKNNWTTKQIAKACMKSFLEIEPID